jgi:hypothetical protein
MVKQMCGSRRGEDNRALDKYISSRIDNTEDIEIIVSKFSEALTAYCDKSFKKARTPTKTQNVPWCTEDLTTARKRVNAYRRKYKRTKTVTIHVAA